MSDSVLREELLELFDGQYLAAYVFQFEGGPVQLLPIAIGSEERCTEMASIAPRRVLSRDAAAVAYAAVVVGQYHDVMEHFQTVENEEYNVIQFPLNRDDVT